MRLRHYPKSNGAPMAQPDLRHHWNFPRAGDGAKPRAIAPSHHGAPMAQTRLARASHHTRYAPPALCLRRRSEPHRWSPCQPIRTELHARAILQKPTLEVRKARPSAHSHARQGWEELVPLRVILISEISPRCDRASLHLADHLSNEQLALAAVTIDPTQVFDVATSCRDSWEEYGKIDRRQRVLAGLKINPKPGAATKHGDSEIPSDVRQIGTRLGVAVEENHPLRLYSITYPAIAAALLKLFCLRGIRQ